MPNSLRAAALAAAVLFFSAIAHGGTIHGTVKNGTTGKPAPGIQVILIQLQGGMQPVANSQSDAQGQFTFENPGLGVQPMLVRAVYHGINFHQPVPPGKDAVEVQIFETSRDAKTISVPTHVVIFQPNGSSLTVGEEYEIENRVQPPQAFFKTDGNFDFAIPDKAHLQNISAAGPTGMPVVQAPIDRGKNRYSIAFAFRPGQNIVRYSYELPYEGNSASVTIPVVYAESRLLVVAPPTVQIVGEGLQPAGQEQGMSLYGLQGSLMGKEYAIKVSGIAPPLDESAGAQGRDAQQPDGAATIQTVPGRLDEAKWYIVGGFLIAFGLFAFLLARKQVVVVPAADSVVAEGVAQFSTRIMDSTNTPAVNTTPSVSSASMAAVDAAVSTSLDGLKEQIFRLELRHQAGTITEADYAQERARMEMLLRELVQG